MFKTILVATDGSEPADKAVTTAATLAKTFASRLVVVHVVPYGAVSHKLRRLFRAEYLAAPGSRPPTREAEGGETGDAGEPEPMDIGREILRRAEQMARDVGVENVEGKLRRGDPAPEIADCAKQENADLLAVGTRGLGGIEGLLVGSVSHKVWHLAECPCATVR